MTPGWTEVRAWRKSRRAELLAQRLTLPRSEVLRCVARVAAAVAAEFPELQHACVGFYCPFKGELDLRPLVRELLESGAEAALPVVPEKGRPLEFWQWRPGMKLGRGIWNIPIPAERNPLRPTALLVPLVGFDAAGYRLGYGGGYYDRTLARLDPKPLTVGVGYAAGRLETIFPQPHDIPLDAIVTEAGVVRHRYRGRALPAARHQTLLVDSEAGRYASPPCSMHELDPTYLGYMGREEVVALLNQLLEGERAGARAVAEMSRAQGEGAQRTALREVAMDEARFCAMLTRHVARLGGTPSKATGAFYGKVIALEAPAERIELLNRGQGWVVRKLRDAVGRIEDAALLDDLKDMLEVHERNIERCDALS